MAQRLYIDFDEYIRQGEPRLDTPTSTPTSTRQVPVQVPVQVGNQFVTDNENIKRLVAAIGNSRLSVKEMMAAVGLKHRMTFMDYSLNPAITEGFVHMLYPESPRHPRQKYLLTVKGIGLYNLIARKEG